MRNNNIKALKNINLRELLIEHQITDSKYDELKDLLDRFSNKIENGDEVNKTGFEQEVYAITSKRGDYHFCEELTKLLFEENKWSEIFLKLYSRSLKYKFYMEQRNMPNNTKEF